MVIMLVAMVVVEMMVTMMAAVVVGCGGNKGCGSDAINSKLRFRARQAAYTFVSFFFWADNHKRMFCHCLPRDGLSLQTKDQR